MRTQSPSTVTADPDPSASGDLEPVVSTFGDEQIKMEDDNFKPDASCSEATATPTADDHPQNSTLSENVNKEAGPSEKKEESEKVAAESSSEASCSDDGPQARKRERRDEQSTDTEANSFPRRLRPRNRRYRNHSNNQGSDHESSGGEPNAAPQQAGPNGSASSDDDDSYIGERLLDILRRSHSRALDSDDTWSMIDSDDSESDVGIARMPDTVDSDEEDTEENLKYQLCLQKEKPKHKWSVTKEVMNRQWGMHTNQQEPELFWQRCYRSLHCVKRLELMYKLDEHHGCVNAVHFNRSGTRLASGSDDKRVIVWDWPVGRSVVSYASGHTSNIFQAKFLPLSGDTHMVTAARDGQVRLAVLSSTGECRSTRCLAEHRRPVNKLALNSETPHVFLSAGEDAFVMSIDVRRSKPSKLVCVKEDHKKVGLYSVDSHPLNNQEFCVSGVDQFIRVYDKRKPDAPLKKLCPHHLVGSSKSYTNVTCAVYSYNGAEILGSYNDESIYLFDARHSDGAEFVHKYEGHRNSATVKGVNFFGPRSEYVMSGSDCGNIFIWDKHTEAIVQFMRGDEKGVVNGLVGHPQFPILATVGLDTDIKVWVPSCEQDPEMKDLRKTVISNMRDRLENRPDRIGIFERSMWPQLRHFELRRVGIPAQLRARFEGMEGDTERGTQARNDYTFSSDSDSDDMGTPRVQCPPS